MHLNGKEVQVLAVDFDGCLVTKDFPRIGQPIWQNINLVLEEMKRGTKLILFTARRGEKLEEAVKFTSELGIEWDAVNENLPEVIVLFGGDTRKIVADEYWDDRAVQMGEKTDLGEFSDGFHTFNSLYYQRMVLFATLVNLFPDRSWKSTRHEDGKPCFDGGWFVVGIETPEGYYNYHYRLQDWDLFDCTVLEKAPHWDGHTEDDVKRLLSLPRYLTVSFMEEIL